jgi:hypothetical protein
MHLLSILSQPQPSHDALQAAVAFVASIAPAAYVHFRKQTEFEYNFAQVFKPHAPAACEWRVARQGCWNACTRVLFAASIILPKGAATVYFI